VIKINATALPTSVNNFVGGIEPIFEFIKTALTTITGFIRGIITQYFPGYESLILLAIALITAYAVGRKSPIPTWVIIGISLFIILRYI